MSVWLLLVIVEMKYLDLSPSRRLKVHTVMRLTCLETNNSGAVAHMVLGGDQGIAIRRQSIKVNKRNDVELSCVYVC